MILEPLGKLMALLSALTTRELSNTPSSVSVLNKRLSLAMDWVAPLLSVCSKRTAPSAKSMSRARLYETLSAEITVFVPPFSTEIFTLPSKVKSSSPFFSSFLFPLLSAFMIVMTVLESLFSAPSSSAPLFLDFFFFLPFAPSSFCDSSPLFSSELSPAAAPDFSLSFLSELSSPFAFSKRLASASSLLRITLAAASELSASFSSAAKTNPAKSAHAAKRKRIFLKQLFFTSNFFLPATFFNR